jgi:hypothetical protein
VFILPPDQGRYYCADIWNATEGILAPSIMSCEMAAFRAFFKEAKRWMLPLRYSSNLRRRLIGRIFYTTDLL